MRSGSGPGNTSDQTVIEQVKDDLRNWRLGRVVAVCDSGFSSRENMAYLRRAGGHYITGIKMREGSAEATEAMSRQGRYQDVRDNLRVKEVRLEIRMIRCAAGLLIEQRLEHWTNPVAGDRDSGACPSQPSSIGVPTYPASSSEQETCEGLRMRASPFERLFRGMRHCPRFGLTWCLWHAGRLDEAGLVADRLPPGRARDIALTMLAAVVRRRARTPRSTPGRPRTWW